jgi:hypothetical protein
MAVVIWDGSAADGDFTNTANWSTGSNPTTGDHVWFNTGSESVTTGLTPSLVTYASFNVTNDYTGLIGTEASFLTINSTLVNIGGGSGAGSQRINLNLGTVTSTVKITSSNGTGADTNRAPIRIVCNTTNTDFFISGDTSYVGIIDEPDDSGSIGDINVSGGTTIIGSGITDYDALNVSGSATTVTVEEPDTAATITIDDGTVTINGTNAVAAVVQRGGEVISNTTGTTTAYTLRGGILDLQQSDQARTFTTLTQSPLGTTVRHQEGVVTITNYNRDTNYKLYTISMSES